MLMRNKCGNNVIAVANAANEILLRHSGKEFYGKEEELVYLTEGMLIINLDVAEKYGIKIEEKRGGKK